MAKQTSSYKEWLGAKLTDPKRSARYLNAALQDSPEMFLKALRKVAESRQMTKVAEEAGVTREQLYRITSDNGNPTYYSLGGILRALGLAFIVQPIESVSDPLLTTGQPPVNKDEHTPLRTSHEDRSLSTLSLGSSRLNDYVNISSAIPSANQNIGWTGDISIVAGRQLWNTSASSAANATINSRVPLTEDSARWIGGTAIYG
jgi:probable addiction module antidote protein